MPLTPEDLDIFCFRMPAFAALAYVDADSVDYRVMLARAKAARTAPSNQHNFTPDYNDGSLTRGEALDMIMDAGGEDDPLDALEALHHMWIGHSDHGCADAYSLAEYLRDYVAEACMDMDGDAIRSDGPRDSDFTGISQ